VSLLPWLCCFHASEAFAQPSLFSLLSSLSLSLCPPLSDDDDGVMVINGQCIIMSNAANATPRGAHRRTNWVPRKKMLTILRNRKSAAACRSTIVELKAELARCQLELNLRDQIAELLHAPATPIGEGRPLDLSGDGQADAVGYDTNGDGRVDALDTNGDGKIDSKIMVSLRGCVSAWLAAWLRCWLHGWLCAICVIQACHTVAACL
jgi:hypothetical protein